MSHTTVQLYSDIAFEDAKDRLFALLCEQGWKCGPSWECDRDVQLSKRGVTYMNAREGYATEGAWPFASMWASAPRPNRVDHGDVAICIRDGQWAEEHDLITHDDFPLVVQRGLAGPGSLVTVEPSPGFPAFGLHAVEACLEILNRGEPRRRAVRRQWHNDLVALNNQSLEPGIRGVKLTIDALTQAVTQGQTLPRLSPTSFREELVAAAGDLHPHTQRCLRTAEMLAPLMAEGLDASAVIIQYTKAVELELQDKLLIPLKQYWSIRQTPSRRGSRELQRLYAYLFSGGHLELGSTGYFVRMSFKPWCDGDPVAESVRRVLHRLPDPDWCRTQLADELLYLASTARNPAAHTGIFESDDLPRIRRLVLGDARKPGLLERLVTTAAAHP